MLNNVIISGASSGLGRALAINYARPGLTLGLLGRDSGRLTETATEVMARGGAVRLGVFDVRDRVAMREFLLDFDARAPIDALIASAGVT